MDFIRTNKVSNSYDLSGRENHETSAKVISRLLALYFINGYHFIAIDKGGNN